MPVLVRRRWGWVALFVLALPFVVHHGGSAALERRGPNLVDVQGKQSAPKQRTEQRRPSPALPVLVEEMRQALLAASHSGDIEDLREPLEWNELKPDIGAPANEDAIDFWKRTSGDGRGIEILAVLAEILPMPAAELPLGPDIENNIIYVWPYLAEAKLDELTPKEEVDLMRLVGPAEAKAMRDAKKWTWWRLTIGADGTWHAFKKGE